MRTARVLLLFLFSFQAAVAQDRFTDSLAAKISLYQLKHPGTTLFVHFDKNVYTGNETAWFTAYVINKTQASALYHTLSVALVKDADQSIAVQRQYILANGIAFGDLVIPDSLPAGNYHFIASTNRTIDKLPEVTFVQPITLKTNQDPPFQASLRVVDSLAADGFYKISFEGFTKDKMLLKNAALSYHLPGMAPGASMTAKSNERGEYLFNIPVAAMQRNKLFQVRVNYQKEIQDLAIQLPALKKQPVVKFYPEGGSLVTAVPGIVGWEARSENGGPMQLEGILYRNEHPVDTISTNSLGLGKFHLTPVKGVQYSLRLVGNAASWPLPVAVDDGASMSLAEAVVNDTLKVIVRNNKADGGRIVVHNSRGLYVCYALPVDKYGFTAKVLLNDVPKGLSTITLLDNEGRPLAERIFFAHYNRREPLTVTTNKPEYKPREKVDLSLTLHDNSGQPLKGMVSVACVQENRLQMSHTTDIENYLYLTRELGDLPTDPMGDGIRRKEYLESILLVKGWRKYTWRDAVAVQPADTVHQYASLQTGGTVTRLGKPLKKPVSVSLVRESGFSMATSDSTGKFTIAPEDLVLAPGKKLMISVNEKNQENYEIVLNDPYPAIAAAIEKEVPAYQDDVALATSTQSLLINRNERTIMMNEIKLTSEKDNSFFGNKFEHVNACGDYVCPYNILNCPNHAGGLDNKAPKAGQSYKSMGGMIVYSGCTAADQHKKPNVLITDGTFSSREFYGSDYSEFSPSQPEYFSTILWKHGILLDAGKAKLDFYTSDITGKFKIVVQGISADDVIYGESTFGVRKPVK